MSRREKRYMSKNKKFEIIMILSAFILLFYNLAARVNSYSTTLLAFTYKYGFIPRGLLGTIYQGLNDLLPINMNVYAAVNIFTLIMTCLYTGFMVWVLKKLLSKIGDTTQDDFSDVAGPWKSIYSLIMFALICAIPTFAGYYNFGRVDMYMLIMSLCAMMLIVYDKAIWLVVPLVALGEMFHEAYVFMYFSMILALLVYRILDEIGKIDDLDAGVINYVKAAFAHKSVRRYLWVTVLSVAVVSGLFLYFRFGYEYGDKKVADQIYDTAYGMTYDNFVHKDVIRAEILGVDLTEEEIEYHVENFIEFPFFILLMSPFIGILVGLYRHVFRQIRDNKLQGLLRFKYLVMIVGVLTLIPLLAMKVDYGRWCFAAVMYYVMTLLAMMAMGDEVVFDGWRSTIVKLREKWLLGPVLLAYAMMLTPFTDLSIGKFCYQIYDFPNKILRMMEIIPFN